MRYLIKKVGMDNYSPFWYDKSKTYIIIRMVYEDREILYRASSLHVNEDGNYVFIRANGDKITVLDNNKISITWKVDNSPS